MEWTPLHTAFYRDPAIVRAGEQAEALYLRCVAYSGEMETRGRVPQSFLKSLCPTRTKARLDALLRENLLEIEGENVVIRSWEKWQERLHVEADKRRRDAERKRRNRAAERAASADASADSPRTVRAESRLIEVEREEEKEERPTDVLAAGKPPTSTRGTRVPDSFPLTDDLRAWGKENCPAVDGRRETENWMDWHRAKGDTAKDWVASWRTWMRKAQKDAERAGGPRLAGRPAQSTTDQRVQQGLALVEHFRAQDDEQRQLGAS